MLADRVRMGSGIQKELPPIIIEDFESGNLNNWIIQYPNVGTVENSRTSVYEGEYSLYMRGGNSGEKDNMIYSLKGLPRYPKKGDTVSFKYNHISDGVRFIFAMQDINNYYFVHVYNNTAGGSTLAIDKCVDGNTSTISSLTTETYLLDKNIWYEVRVEWKKDGTIILTLLDGEIVKDSISGVDTEFSSGGIGFIIYADRGKGGSRSEGYVDNIKIGER